MTTNVWLKQGCIKFKELAGATVIVGSVAQKGMSLVLMDWQDAER